MNSEEKKIILKTEGLTKHYGGVKALHDADFTLADGEHVAIVGDNGAGKSTFIRQVTGVEIPTSGKIYFDQSVVIDYNSSRCKKSWNRGCVSKFSFS